MHNAQKRRVYQTRDGSKSIYWPEFDEYYHSIHGAITESEHVFIEHGLRACNQTEITILEVGFGTGLNAFLSFNETKSRELKIIYHAIEAFPISIDEFKQLDFEQLFTNDILNSKLHELNWEVEHKIKENFRFKKIRNTLQNFDAKNEYDLVYYDAFAPSAQPELWEWHMFKKVYNMMKQNSILTTYCAKGQVKRDLKSIGFKVESLPGPPGKREMIRAIKI